LKVRYKTDEGYSGHTLAGSLNEGENEFTIDFNNKSFSANNGYVTTFQKVPIAGTNVLYVHAHNLGDSLYMTDNDFDLRELKITSNDTLRCRIVPISYYGRHRFLDTKSSGIGIVNLLKHTPSS
jgi:hypothetical protein